MGAEPIDQRPGLGGAPLKVRKFEAQRGDRRREGVRVVLPRQHCARHSIVGGSAVASVASRAM